MTDQPMTATTFKDWQTVGEKMPPDDGESILVWDGEDWGLVFRDGDRWEYTCGCGPDFAVQSDQIWCLPPKAPVVGIAVQSSKTDQPMTATIPMDLLQGYVALLRLVDGALFSGGNEVAYIPSRYDIDRIASACLAIDKLLKTEGEK